MIYDLGIYLYKLGVAVASLFSPTIAGMRRGEREAIKLVRQRVQPGERWVWVHAASLGEFEQGRPLIERIKNSDPNAKILPTFFSPSGYNVRKNYDRADLVVYLPLDTPSAARQFVNALNPQKVYIVKYEFWLNYLRELRKRNIPTYLISAIFRPGQIFFRWYGGRFRRCLGTFKTLYVQNDKSRELLRGIGVTNVKVTGDTRFDRVADIAAAARQLPKIADFTANHSTIVAGSTWLPDEQLLAQYINENCQKGIRMIIAPHHTEESRIREIRSMLRCRSVLYTELTDDTPVVADVLIINTIGILSSVYQYGEVAYIGGGFGVGIHNTLEAAVWGAPVVFGPNYHKFNEACQLIDCGGAKSITDWPSCRDAIDGFLDNRDAAAAAKHYVHSHIGASSIIYSETT